ncbi:MAG TPA: HEAT repeat domain-containing protein [Planctomycetota bacterium]|nr:HEAT repeat domain-containing protein [Planctomycetota bacterium]
MTCLLLAFLVGRQDPSEILDRLRSDRIEEREEAARRILSEGRPFLPFLQKARLDPDSEVAERAYSLIRVIQGTDRLTPGLLSAFPGLEDRLGDGDDPAWTAALRAAVAARRPREDLRPLAPRAVRGARTREEKCEVCRLVQFMEFREACPDLLGLLGEKDPDVLAAAIGALRLLRAQEAVAPALALLDHPDAQRRIRALALLPYLDAPESIPRATRLLGDREGGVRGTAAIILAQLEGKGAIPKLLLVLKLDPAPWVRIQAMQGLVEVAGPDACPALAGHLEDRDAEVRMRALSHLLCQRGRTHEAKIVGRLGDPDPKVRLLAIDAVLGLNLRSCGPGLVALLGDREPAIRARAAKALGLLRRQEAIPALLPLLRDPGTEVRKSAALSLGHLHAREAASELIRLLEDPAARDAAVTALGQAGIAQAAPRIAGLLREGRGLNRPRACEVLADLGSKEAVPVFLELLDQDSPGLTRAAIRALGRLGEESASPKIRSLLVQRDLRTAAAEALSDLRDKESVPFLLVFLWSDDLRSSSEALWSLAGMGAAEATGSLVTLARDVEGHHREEAVEALGLMGDVEAAPVLLELLEDESPAIRAAAARALGEMGYKKAVPALLNVVRQGQGAARAAAEALGHLEAREEIPALSELLGHAEPAVRVGAASALAFLGSPTGVPVLLKEGTDLEALNVLRAKDAWRRLSSTRMSTVLDVTPAWNLPKLEKATSMRIEPSRASDLDLGQAQFALSQGWGARMRALEALALLHDGKCEVVLEPGVIRLVSHEEAIQFWRAWWETEQKK